MYLLQIEQILQFSAVVIFDDQYDEFLFLSTVRKIQHIKKNHGPGPPCKSGDITGWGLKDKEVNT